MLRIKYYLQIMTSTITFHWVMETLVQRSHHDRQRVKHWRRCLRSTCGCERRSLWTVTVEHPTESIMLYCMTNSFCINNDFGRFSAIFFGIFLVVSACSLNVLEILRISEFDREQLRNQQHLFHNHSAQWFTRALSDFRII